MNAEQIEEKSRLHKRNGFAKWLEQPMTRALVSMIPASEGKDVVQTVLQAAWESGYDTGVGVGMLMVIESIMKEPRR